MKYFAIFLTLTFLTTTPMTWVRHELDDTDFAFEIPKAWKVLCDQPRKLVIEEKVRAGAEAKSVLAVRAMDGGVPLEQWIPHHRENGIQAMYPDCAILAEESSTLGYFDSHIFHVDIGKGPRRSVHFEMYESLVHSGDSVLCISLTFDRRNRDARRDLFDHVNRSLGRTKAIGNGIRWCPDFERGFRMARERNVPVMIALNMDGDDACEQILRSHYKQREIVALSEEMICLIASNYKHSTQATEDCPRFPSITCTIHNDIFKKVKKRYIPADPETGRWSVHYPQHIFCRPDGSVIERRDFHLPPKELIRSMKASIEEVRDSAAEGG